jgi:hypothetical protein
MKLYTPGHGFFMDSLIMYGIISCLPSDIKYCVFSNAGLFEIEIENRSIHDISDHIASRIDQYKEDIVRSLVEQSKLVQKGSQRRLETFLRKYSDPNIVAQDLEQAYMSPGHAQNEGRFHRGQHVWLPLYPHVGKYFTGEYRYQASNYGVCPLCITLAVVGFNEAAILVPYKPPKNASLVVMFSFEGKVSGKVLGEMLSFIGDEDFHQAINKLRPIINDIPLNIFIHMLLAKWTKEIIIYLYKSNAAWTAFSTTFEIVKGQVAQVRGYKEISIDRYLSSLAYLIQVDERYKYDLNPLERLRIITDYLVKSGEPAAVEALYRFLNTRLTSDLYRAVRQIDKVGGIIGKSFCKELVWLTHLA